MVVQRKILGVLNIRCLLCWLDYDVGRHGALASQRHLHELNSSSGWLYTGAFGLPMGVNAMAFKTTTSVPSVTNATKR